jgi:thymidylate synthase
MIDLIDIEDVYLSALDTVYTHGRHKKDRTGTGTISMAGITMQWDVNQKFFPIIRSKLVWHAGYAVELSWFMRGRTDLQYLHDNGVKYWDAWGTPEQCAKFNRQPGDLGPTYGKQWRDFNGFDQLAQVCEQLKTNPDSRRIIMSLWNPSDALEVAVPPCPCFIQLIPSPEDANGWRSVDMVLYQRSGDMFLGVPFDQSQYSLFLILICQACSTEQHILTPGRMTHTIGDAHIYDTHINQVEEQFKREDEAKHLIRPTLAINDAAICSGGGLEALVAWEPKTAVLEDYQHLGRLSAEVAI